MRPTNINRIRNWTRAAAAAVFALSTVFVGAQSADALIDKLVDKGILTVKEAQDLREEADKDFTKAYASKSGMSEWVTALKFNGDVRMRYDSLMGDNQFLVAGATNSFVNRNRFRLRARFGVTATLMDDFEAGFKLTTAEQTGGSGGNAGAFGGNPLSGNSTFQDNGSKKFIFVDQAYGKWSPLQGPDWTGSITLGKFENPFLTSDMVFDPDYTPEGGAIQLGYQLNDAHRLKLTTGGFILDEFSLSSHDPYLGGAQLRWDATWSPKWSSTLGLAGYSLQNADTLTNGVVPNVNRGNTRKSNETPAYDFNPWVVDGALTCNLDSFPFYTGVFPVKIGGEFMQNPAAPSSADNFAWNAGIMFGKSGKKGTWDLSYTYKWLGANAWYEEIVDDDFGAFYGSLNSPANSGAGIGYGAGTNVKGHIVRLAYSPYDCLTLSVKWFLTDLIVPYPSLAGSKSEMNRIFVDAMLKF